MFSVRGKRASIKIARDFRCKPSSLITKGHISKQGFLIKTMKLKDFIVFVYTNELLVFLGLLFRFLNLNSKNEINKIKVHPKKLTINPKNIVVKPSS